jgi:hypothetical protein
VSVITIRSLGASVPPVTFAVAALPWRPINVDSAGTLRAPAQIFCMA